MNPARRFGTSRWIFDAAALRHERKACAVLAGASDFLERTGVQGLDMDLDTFAAIRLLEHLRRQVSADFQAANRAAKREAR